MVSPMLWVAYTKFTLVDGLQHGSSRFIEKEVEFKFAFRKFDTFLRNRVRVAKFTNQTD